MKKILIGLLSLAPFVSYSASDKVVIKNVQDLTNYGQNTFVYSLPLTKLMINISAVKHFTVPGPYYQYAEKYLGLKGTAVPVERWEVNNINLQAYDEPDAEQYFAVEGLGSERIIKNLLEMSDAGLVLKVDATNPFVQYIPDYSNYTDPHQYTDLSIKKNFVDPNDREKVKSKKGDLTADVPIGKHKSGIKTIEEKAEEAANFIFKIRKRRFKLLAGQYDSFPEGAALEISIRELNKLEEDYLSLFIGKTYCDTITKSFYYIPHPDQEIDRFVISYFSNETGFTDTQSGAGKSLVLELKDLQQTAPLDKLEMPLTTGNAKNCVMYRIPDKASVHVYIGSMVALEGEIKVYQYGSMVPYCIIEK